MNPQDYLRRIGLGDWTPAVDHAGLALLQKSHQERVPFENLDIYWKVPIAIDSERFFTKIVENGRGGFCYELNGLFNELLQALGFETRLISARVANGDGHGPEFDHAAIVVRLGDDELLTDVGFGSFTAEPLRYVLDKEQNDRNGTFMIRRFADDQLEVVQQVESEWKSQYIFTDTPRELSEFARMCEFQQTSPDSHFTKGAMCSIMTSDGRKTLTDKKFIVTSAGEKSETNIESAADFERILLAEFGISSPAAAASSAT